MAKLRRRDRGAGTRYFIRTADGHELSAGRDARTAKRLLDHYRNLEQLVRHGVPVRLRSTWTLERLSKWDLRDCRDDSRRRRWAVLLRELGKATPIDDLDPATLMAYREGRKASPATINRDLSVLSSALNRAKPLSGSENDPLRGLRKLEEARTRPVVYPPEAIQTFISGCWAIASEAPKGRRSIEWPQNAAMVEILYLTASRLSQVLSLRADQVRGDLLYFPPHKKGVERWFRLEGRLAILIAQVSGIERGTLSGAPYLFPSVRSSGAREGFRRFWSKACERAKLTMTPHTLRHSRASAWYAEGRTIAEVQRLLGHASPQMAFRLYASLFPETMPPSLPRE